MSPDIAEHVRLMYEITWGPVLSVFSEVSQRTLHAYSGRLNKTKPVGFWRGDCCDTVGRHRTRVWNKIGAMGTYLVAQQWHNKKVAHVCTIVLTKNINNAKKYK